MTAIAVQTTASTSVSPAATTAAATQPSGIANDDLLVAFVAKNTTTAPSTVPSGWSLAVRGPGGGTLGANVGTGWAGVYLKKAASESGTYTWGSTSSIWQIQIYRLSPYRGPAPGSVYVSALVFNAGKVNTRTTTTISQGAMVTCELAHDGYLMIHQFVQTIATTAPVFSALSGSMTSVANVSQNAAAALTQQTAWEYIDMTSNPNFGSRQVTTDTAGGSTGGYCILISDPSSLAGISTDKRNDLRPRAS